MTEHHGLDLDAIEAASGGHSIFAPSGSYMWLVCSGSLIPNLLAEDNSGYDAAEGTAAHEIGEEWLRGVLSDSDWAGAVESMNDDGGELLAEIVDSWSPTRHLGTVKRIVERVDDEGRPTLWFDIPITEIMFTHLRKYVLWCASLPGQHFVETRVDHSDLTPLENQGGTADHAAVNETTLTITDLKYGKGVRVDAAYDLTSALAMIHGQETPFNGNPQAMIYAYGFLRKLEGLYDIERVVIRIAQPRIGDEGHWQTWETTADQLRAFARYAKVRAHDAWVLDAPRTASSKGCQFCKVKNDCAAHAAYLDDAIDGYFDATTAVIEGSFRVVDTDRALAVKQKIDDREFAKSLPDPGRLSTAQMAYVYRMRKSVESWFNAMGEELLYRAKSGEDVPWHKVVKGRDGDRKLLEHDGLAEDLEFIGLSEDDIYERVLKSPPKLAELLRTKYGLTKKNADTLLESVVTRAPGRDTLVSNGDPREELLDDLGDVFDPVDEDEL